MINPYKLTDGKKYAVIQGYVIDVKDRGDANMVLFKKDPTIRHPSLLRSQPGHCLKDRPARIFAK